MNYEDEFSSEMQQPARQKQSRSSRTFYLQPRDFNILESLSTARFLTTENLEWLHYPSWRKHYREHIEDQTQNKKGYRPSPHLYVRIAAMAERSLVNRITRAGPNTNAGYIRLASAYSLSKQGAEILCTYRMIPVQSLWYADASRLSIQNLEHCIDIGQFYAALRSELEYRGLEFGQWRGDHLLASQSQAIGVQFDRVSIPGQREPVAVLPDATFVFQHQRYFVEIDRGTRAMQAWAERARALAAYLGHRLLKERYDTDSFIMLIVTPTLARSTRIAEEISKVNQNILKACRFCIADHIHPTTIRRAWNKVGDIRWSNKMVGNKMTQNPTVHFEPEPLWTV